MSYSISVPGDEDATTNDLNRWSASPSPLSYCTGLKSLHLCICKFCPIFIMVPPSLYHQWHPPPHQHHSQHHPCSHPPPPPPPPDHPHPSPPHPDPPHPDHPDKEGIMAVLAPSSPSIIPNCSSFAGLLPLLLAHLLLTNLLQQIPKAPNWQKANQKLQIETSEQGQTYFAICSLPNYHALLLTSLKIKTAQNPFIARWMFSYYWKKFLRGGPPWEVFRPVVSSFMEYHLICKVNH